ncbi:sodium-dependent glucose transporter 1-like protein [Leptotrombidium deliense]|uniref:Sodium-dependent glucose transporter 1-like protein n=1 Tax=Leptotrombidium deliense TaxID=299467 RepID=A0A443SEZ1_9ACAR|nr:sodium-dependent glucose transporter 1-like protein [Leptotrombidium deliense]
MGIVSIIIPNVTELIGHLVFQLIVGITVGVIEVGGNVKILNMWKKDGGPHMQALSFVWTAAAAVVPLMLVPFLSSKHDNLNCKYNATDCNSTVTENATMNTFNQTAEDAELIKEFNDFEHQTQIWIPYSLLGVSLIISGLVALIFGVKQMLRNRSRKTPIAEEKNTETTVELIKHNDSDKTEKYYKIACVILGCLLLFIFYGFSDTTWQYWVTFVMFSDLKLSKKSGVFMLSAMNVSFAITNFLGIFIAAKVKPFKILIVLTSLLATGNIIHLLFANSSLTMLWIGAIVETIGFGCIYATVFNYLQRRVGITNTIGSFLVFAAWFANAMGYSVLIGHYIERYPMTLIYTNLMSIAVIFLCLMGLLYFERKLKNIAKCKYNAVSKSTNQNLLHFKQNVET